MSESRLQMPLSSLGGCMFGEIEKKLRIERGFQQKDVADDLGLSRASLCRYEKNEREPSLKTLIAFCDYYGVSADVILGRTVGEDEHETT